MALTHPTLDPLVAEFKTIGLAITCLHRDKDHPLLQGMTDKATKLAELEASRNEIDAKIAVVAAKVRKERDEAQLLADLTAAEESHGDLTDDLLEEVIAKAHEEVDAAQAALRLLQLEAIRRRGETKARKQIEGLSPQAKALFQKLSVAKTASTTKVNSVGG